MQSKSATRNPSNTPKSSVTAEPLKIHPSSALQSPDDILDAARASDMGPESTQAEGTATTVSLPERLREIDSLKSQGIITEDEYQQLKQQALEI